MTGSVLGRRFELVELLGGGKMAEVYGARDLLLDRVVALKVLRAHAEKSGARVLFLHEAKTLAALDSPHLAPVYDVGRDRGRSYLVMKRANGRSLREMLVGAGAIGPARAVAIVAQVLRGLAHLHQRGLVHRDIKPANVMIGAGDHVVLVDRGVAFALSTAAADQGAVAGTPNYMAPEQRTSAQADARSDLYSVGLVLFEAIAGRLPFVGETTSGLSATALSSIPAPLTEVVMRALDPDPQRRYGTPLEMRASLLRAEIGGRRSASCAPTPAPPAEQMSPPAPTHSDDPTVRRW